jgi:O-antigen/teichoic acid export membrane protein
MTRIKRLAKEGSWIVVGDIMSVIASLVLVRLLTEHLDPAQYGLLALALTLGTLIGQVAFSGYMPGIMRYYAIAAEKGEASEYLLAARRMMGYGSIIALGLSALLLLGLPLFGKADILALTSMCIIFTILSSYNSTQSMIQNAARQRQVVVLHGTLYSWMRVLFAGGMMFLLGNSAKVVVAAYIVSLLLVLISQAIFIRRLIPRKVTCAAKSKPWGAQIWKFSKPFVFFNTFTWIQVSSDRWALDTFTTTNDVGLYAVLFQLGYTPIGMLAGLMTTLIGPILFQRSGDTADPSRNASVHKSVWQITAIGLLSTLLACLFAFLFHDWIFQLLVAAQYRSVSYLLPLMILAGGLTSSGQVLALKLMSDLNTQALIWPKIVTSLLGAALSFAGAYFVGLKGVVYGMVIFSVLQFLWMGWLSWHPIGTHNKGHA